MNIEACANAGALTMDGALVRDGAFTIDGALVRDGAFTIDGALVSGAALMNDDTLVSGAAAALSIISMALSLSRFFSKCLFFAATKPAIATAAPSAAIHASALLSELKLSSWPLFVFPESVVTVVASESVLLLLLVELDAELVLLVLDDPLLVHPTLSGPGPHKKRPKNDDLSSVVSLINLSPLVSNFPLWLAALRNIKEPSTARH